MIKRFLALCCALCVAGSLRAADSDNGSEQGHTPPILSAHFAPDSVGIGDHATLIVDVDQDVMQVVAFPEFNFDEQDADMELVSEPTLDTISKEGRRVKLRRKYVLRSFDAGNYNMGRISVLYADKNVTDTLYADDSLRLRVGTFRIDSTSHSIFDIKPVRDMPFQFKEISGYATWGVIVLILLVLIIIAALKIMAHYGKSVFGLFKPAPPVPAHVAAFKALDSLKQQHLWQNGEYKSYYSQLTDILRTYISGRYGVAAMEMTSAEIIAASKELELPKRCEMEIQELLRDADLVKFAKAEIQASKNEEYFVNVRKFVDLTKILEETEEKAEPVVNLDEELQIDPTEQSTEISNIVEEVKAIEATEEVNPYAPKPRVDDDDK